jgi:DNA (cytosine-5)-methyltransferase 1
LTRRLLDLYCGEGGAARGYIRAGWTVTGVDTRQLRARYPGTFVRADAITYLTEHAGEFDAVHASPPCQAFTSLRRFPAQLARDEQTLFEWTRHPDLVAATRAALLASGLPWIMENVPGAPLRDPIILCGSMFGLAAECRDGRRRPLRRHRLFETLPRLAGLPACRHRRDDEPVGVYGNGGGGKWRTRGGYMAVKAEAEAALDVRGMTTHGLAQAIPPAYTAYLGAQLGARIEATV